MLIPGTYIPWLFIAIIVLVIAIIVLAPVFEFVAYVVDLIRAEPTSVDERTNPKLDRRVLVRLGVAGGAAAFPLIVGMTAAYVIRPDSLGSVLLWPLKHPSSLLFGGVGLYLVVLLCGVRPRHRVAVVSGAARIGRHAVAAAGVLRAVAGCNGGACVGVLCALR